MAERVASLYAEIGAKTDGFQKGAAEVKGGLSGLTSLVGQFGLSSVASFTTVAGAVGMAVGALKKAYSAAAEAEVVEARLAATLTATGRASQVSAGQLDKAADALARMSSFDHEDIKSAYAALLRFENIPTDRIQDITEAAMNLTAAMGGDLAGNAETLGRILETGVVPRTYGFSMALRKQIKDEVEAGDTAKALSDILGQMSARFGGQYTAQLNTASGAAEHLKNSWHELFVELGAPMTGASAGVQNGLADAMDNTREAIHHQAEAHDELQGAMSRTQEQVYGLMKSEDLWAAAQGKDTDYILELNGALEEQSTLTEEQAKKMSEARAAQIGLTQNVASENQSYAASFDDLIEKQGELGVEINDATRIYGKNSEKVKDLKGDYADLVGEMEATAEAHQQAMKQMAWDNLFDKLKQSGGELTDVEFNMAQQAGAGLGLWSQADADMAASINELSSALASGQINMTSFLNDVTNTARGGQTAVQGTQKQWSVYATDGAAKSDTMTGSVLNQASAYANLQEGVGNAMSSGESAIQGMQSKWDSFTADTGAKTAQLTGYYQGLIVKLQQLANAIGSLPAFPTLNVGGTEPTNPGRKPHGQIESNFGGAPERTWHVRITGDVNGQSVSPEFIQEVLRQLQ